MKFKSKWGLRIGGTYFVLSLLFFIYVTILIAVGGSDPQLAIGLGLVSLPWVLLIGSLLGEVDSYFGLFSLLLLSVFINAIILYYFGKLFDKRTPDYSTEQKGT